MTRTATIIAVALLGVAPHAYGVEASAFNVATSDNSQIDPAKDHYTVSLDSFWVSNRDSFFQRVFGRTQSGAVTVAANAVLFDADASSLNVQIAHDLKNLRRSVQQPIGIKQTLIEGLPADANLHVKLSIAMYRGNRVGDTLDALEKSKSQLPADLFASPWLGYAKAASAVVESLFSVSETQYPFSFEGDVKAGVVAADGSMPSHYMVLIAPASANDATFSTIDPDKLTYDPAAGRVLYKGAPLTSWSHAVLRISKAPSPNISQLVYSSSAPWAQLAQTQILSGAGPVYGTPTEIRSSADAMYKSLQDVLTFLKKEPRFSKLDRALAMKVFVDIPLTHLRDRCSTVSGTDATCGLLQLADMSSNVDRIFGLVPAGSRGGSHNQALTDEITTKSRALQDELMARPPAPSGTAQR